MVGTDSEHLAAVQGSGTLFRCCLIVMSDRGLIQLLDFVV